MAKKLFETLEVTKFPERYETLDDKKRVDSIDDAWCALSNKERNEWLEMTRGPPSSRKRLAIESVERSEEDADDARRVSAAHLTMCARSETAHAAGIGDFRGANTALLGEPVTGVVTPVALDYTYAASPEESAFYRGLAEGRILGQRCPTCAKVYVPPRSACPADGTPTTDEVELSQTGTVTTFCIVNVPFPGQRITPPYVSAYVLLDGADIAFLHLILDIPADQVRMGMRVEAVWKPREEWGTTIENISHFRPTGEPDAAYDTYSQHL